MEKIILDNQIHVNLKDKELRDMLSQSITNSYDKSQANKVDYIHGLTGVDQSIQMLETNITNQQNDLEHLKNCKAVLRIAQTYGWGEFDPSDYVKISGKTHLSFFGTEKEYNNFLKINKFE